MPFIALPSPEIVLCIYTSEYKYICAEGLAFCNVAEVSPLANVLGSDWLLYAVLSRFW